VRYLRVGAGSTEDFHSGCGWEDGRERGRGGRLVRKGFTIGKNALSQNFAIAAGRPTVRGDERVGRRFDPFDFVAGL